MARPKRKRPIAKAPDHVDVESAGPKIVLVGIDCATLAEKTGFAVGTFDVSTKRLRVTDAKCCKRGEELAALAADAAGDGPALIALDAPLGWPVPLAETLSWHQAGAPLGSPVLPDDRMFSRATDLEIRDRFRKRPLEVGADRIARTARAALRLIADVEIRRNKTVPLAWTPGAVDGVSAIEVYPAATLSSRRIASKGYRQEAKRRRSVLTALALDLPKGLERLLTANPHALDAVICLVAAADFASGHVRPPPLDQASLARREGWIWVRDPLDS